MPQPTPICMLYLFSFFAQSVNGFYYNRLPCDDALANSRELFSTKFPSQNGPISERLMQMQMISMANAIEDTSLY